MRRILYSLIAILVLAAVWAGFFNSSKPNVLLLVLDTLRADHMGCYGYERDTSPVMDRFARENLKFNFAQTASSWTPAAVASILTGLYVSAHGMMPPNEQPLLTVARKAVSTKLADELETLAEVFHKNGYQTAIVSSNPWLQKAFGYGQGFEHFHYVNRVRAERVNAYGFKVLDLLLADKRPFFLYLHYMDPHEPYNPPEEYKAMFNGPLKSRTYDEEMLREIGLYDGEIRYLDSQLEKLFSRLKEKGVYDDLIIVIVADHGEQFRERGSAGHGFHLHNEEVHVPLFLKTGRQTRRGEVDATVSTVDIFPTLLELAGLKSKQPGQGISLLGDLTKRAGVLSEIKRTANYKSIMDQSGRKLIIGYPLEQDFLAEESAPQSGAWVYDSRGDYFELNPLSDQLLMQNLSASFWSLYHETRRLRIKEEVEQIEIDQKTVSDLQSLGYL